MQKKVLTEQALYYGDAPALTAEQQTQNSAGTHDWGYVWNEANTTWDLTDDLA